MKFSISKHQHQSKHFNNQHFIILGKVLVLLAWKLFSLDSFGHLRHFGENKTFLKINIIFAPLNKYKKLCKINISYCHRAHWRLNNTRKSPTSAVHFRRISSRRRIIAMALNVVTKISLFKKRIFVTSIKAITL